MNKVIKTLDAPQVIGPYSQGIISRNFVYTSGQIHSTPDGGTVEGTIEEQTHQVMKNLMAILKSANTSFKDVIKATVYVTDMSIYEKLNKVYESYMTEPYPAREAVCVKELPRHANIEISMIAVKS